jgi:ABC-type multidrug transport system ATPase subunit
MFDVAQSVRKVYKGGKQAVKNLSFGVPIGQCFGFLGINGAGKTTTLKILSGEILPSSGSARIAGFDILTQQMQLRRLLGWVLCVSLLAVSGTVVIDGVFLPPVPSATVLNLMRCTTC